MKKQIIRVRKQAAAIVLGIVLVGFLVNCSKLRRFDLDGIDASKIPFPCNCIMDTLKGEWKWYKVKAYPIPSGATFQSVLKITDQNSDGSINYEVWVKDTVIFRIIGSSIIYNEIFVNDTLLYQGSFQIKEGLYGYREAINIKLPHYLRSGEWLFSFTNKANLEFWNGAIDGYYYYYQKIK